MPVTVHMVVLESGRVRAVRSTDLLSAFAPLVMLDRPDLGRSPVLVSLAR